MVDIITRFAPSPTGRMHFGSARAAILPFLFALHNEGKFFLRIDDTDIQRSREDFVKQIFTDLEWLNLQYEYVIYQSQRKDIYDEYFNNLVQKGLIYPCYDSEEEIETVREIKRHSKKAPIYSFEDRKNSFGEKPHWRFRLSDKTNEIHDMIFGYLKSNKEWSDPVVKRSDETYCYVFCSVVDDIKESVTHIIRGAEHISNAAVQQQIGDAILNSKWNVKWAHFPMLLSTDGSKLSKRNDSLSLNALRDSSLENWSLVSFLMELGSSNKRIIAHSWEEYIKEFKLEKFSKVPKKFFEKELLERNKLIFRSLPESTITNRGMTIKAWELLKNNCNNWSQLQQMYNQMLSFKISGKEFPPKGKQFYREIFETESGPPSDEVTEYLKNL